MSAFSPIIITPYSWAAAGRSIVSGLGSISGAASAVFPTANTVIGWPFYLNYTFTIRKVFAWLGATLAGNYAIGVCNTDGVILATSGAIAQSSGSVNTINVSSLTAVQIPSGNYYLCLGCDSGTATFFRVAWGLSRSKPFGTISQASAYSTLSGGGTLTINTLNGNSFLPVFGISQGSVI